MKTLLLMTIPFILIACGTNSFAPYDTSADPAEEAARALDEGKSDKALEILDEALASDPNNYVYISLKASAKAQSAGVDTMDFALAMAEEGVSTGGIVGLFSVVPAASASNISLLQEAVTLMESIPSAQLTAGDQFKASMFNTCLMTLHTKALDTDGDGVLSAAELLANLNDSNASDIINSIVGAEDALANYTATDGTADAAGNVSQIKADIDSQAGSTDAEKLRNYLGSN